LKITNQKKAVVSGILAGIYIILAGVVMMYIFSTLTMGESFYSNGEIINGFTHFQFVFVMGLIVAIVSFFSLKYDNKEYLFLYISWLIMSYILIQFLLILIINLNNFNMKLTPLYTFDYIGYALIPIPIGSIIGTIIAIITNSIRNKKRLKGETNA